MGVKDDVRCGWVQTKGARRTGGLAVPTRPWGWGWGWLPSQQQPAAVLERPKRGWRLFLIPGPLLLLLLPPGSLGLN